MIDLYHYSLSPCGEKVRFCLAEKGLTWREISVDLAAKENLRSDYLRLNPKGYVPTLVDDGVVINESTIIIEYLEDRYQEPPLRPTAAADRATMRRWLKHVDEVLHPAWPGMAWPILVRPRWLEKTQAEVEDMLATLLDPARRDRQRLMYELGFDAPDFRTSLAVFSDVLDAMDATLRQSRWLAGNALSLADIAVFPYPFAADAFGLGPWIEAHGAAVTGWYRRMRTHGGTEKLIKTGFSAERMAEVAQLGRDVLSRLGSGAAASPIANG